ncbi:MAG TPA: hypothetical protein VGM03_14580 [Phycisphaerae bacterium]|jgi:hypothetical protein
MSIQAESTSPANRKSDRRPLSFFDFNGRLAFLVLALGLVLIEMSAR